MKMNALGLPVGHVPSSDNRHSELANAPVTTDRAVAPTADYLLGEMQRLSRLFMDEAHAQHLAGHTSGLGSWWEMDGYAAILRHAVERVNTGRRRVARVEAMIQRERASDDS